MYRLTLFSFKLDTKESEAALVMLCSSIAFIQKYSVNYFDTAVAPF